MILEIQAGKGPVAAGARIARFTPTEDLDETFLNVWRGLKPVISELNFSEPFRFAKLRRIRITLLLHRLNYVRNICPVSDHCGQRSLRSAIIVMSILPFSPQSLHGIAAEASCFSQPSHRVFWPHPIFPGTNRLPPTQRGRPPVKALSRSIVSGH